MIIYYFNNVNTYVSIDYITAYFDYRLNELSLGFLVFILSIIFFSIETCTAFNKTYQRNISLIKCQSIAFVAISLSTRCQNFDSIISMHKNKLISLDQSNVCIFIIYVPIPMSLLLGRECEETIQLIDHEFLLSSNSEVEFSLTD